jgi:hypothetical protein
VAVSAFCPSLFDMVLVIENQLIAGILCVFADRQKTEPYNGHQQQRNSV